MYMHHQTMLMHGKTVTGHNIHERCLIGTNHALISSHDLTIQLIIFTFTHNRYTKQNKHEPLWEAIENLRLASQTVHNDHYGVRGAIHMWSINQLEAPPYPFLACQEIVKDVHHIAIIFLTYYIVWNKRKQEGKQEPKLPPPLHSNTLPKTIITSPYSPTTARREVNPIMQLGNSWTR